LFFLLKPYLTRTSYATAIFLNIPLPIPVKTAILCLSNCIPEPIMILYRGDGLPVRQIGRYIRLKSAVLLARHYHNLAGVLRVRPFADGRPGIKRLMLYPGD